MATIMKKATASVKRGSRKKQQQSSNDTTTKQQLEPSQGENPPPPPPVQAPMIKENIYEVKNMKRRQSPTEEASLTAKNYRLAKELSELRVRHRDECKNVSRLTMENMNLASRCREAISHVAMLQKELLMHQERAAESLALQRQQTQRMASNLSTKLTEEKETASHHTEKRLVSTMPPPPPPPAYPQTRSLLNTESSSTVSSSSPDSQRSLISAGSPPDSDWDETAGERPEDRLGPPSSLEENIDPALNKMTPTKVFSTPKKRVSPNVSPQQNETTTTTNMPSGGFFPYSASPKRNSTPRQKTFDDNFPSDIIDQPHRLLQHENGISTSFKEEEDASGGSSSSHSSRPNVVVSVSSIDAFEASFQTAFPESFSPSDESAQKQKENNEGSPIVNGVYNPFFASPDRPDANFIASPSSDFDPHQPSSFGTSNNNDATPTTPEMQQQIMKKNSAWPTDHKFYNTPPGDILRAVSPSSEPKRPEKTPSAEARSRYDKALQPRRSKDENTLSQPNLHSEAVAPIENMTKETIKVTTTTKTGPSPLLKRIHQRRMNKRLLNRQQGAPVPESSSSIEEKYGKPDIITRHDSSPESFSMSPSQNNLGEEEPNLVKHDSNLAKSEIGQPFGEREEGNPFVSAASRLNSQIGSTEHKLKKNARLHALAKSRRNVKQPLSYAEPALNTKLRQGDTYFQKAVGSGTDS